MTSPSSPIHMAQTSPIGLPWIVIIAFGVAFATHLFLNHSQVGRQIYAIGSNPAAAPLREIRVMPVTLLVFTLSGALAGLAGIIYAARFGYVNSGITGVGFEFTVIAAVVIGGVSINGGVGSVAGTVLGVLLLGAVQVALPILRVSGFWQDAIYGLIIVVALVIRSHRARRRLQGPCGEDSVMSVADKPTDGFTARDVAAPRPRWQGDPGSARKPRPLFFWSSPRSSRRGCRRSSPMSASSSRVPPTTSSTASSRLCSPWSSSPARSTFRRHR